MLVLQVGEKPLRRAADGDELIRRGVRRHKVQSGQDALEYLTLTPYDVVLLDLDLPALGQDLVRCIRHANQSVPIIGFTTGMDEGSKVRALDMGADDVQTGACPIDELLARVRAILRRTEGRSQSILQFGALELSMDTREVFAHGERIRFTPKEYAIFEFLARKRGRPVSKSACLSYLYGGEEEPDPKIIDVIICRVRKKLVSAGVRHLIDNVRGYGFKLISDPETSLPQLQIAAEPAFELRDQLKPAMVEVG
jgi:two-component system cell cycle response regulator CtrA